MALGRHQLWTRSLAENDRIGKAQAEEGDSLLINHLLISKATLTNKIMICLLWWLLLFIEMMLDPLWWQKERCEGTVIGQMLARVDGRGAWGGAIEHRWQWSIRATDASGKGVAGILPRICLFTCVCACTWQAGRKKVLWDLRYYRDNFLSKTPNPLKNLSPQPIRLMAMFI